MTISQDPPGTATEPRPQPIIKPTTSATTTSSPSLTTTTTTTTEWHHAGTAALDFRSDVVTKPTAPMLAAITSTTLQDDVYGEDPTTNALESLLASMTGKAAALSVVSGTMGNQVALRTHAGAPPTSLLCDARGHIVNYEAGGVSSVCNVMIIPVSPANGHHLTVGDVAARAVVSGDVHDCPTGVVSLENTLDGMVMPLGELRAIYAWARGRGIAVHLDGARLWEAVAAGVGSLAEFCACADSVNLCFSKGLGAPVGSVLVGDEGFIRQARRVRKMFGGGLRQGGVVSAAARVAVDETFGHLGDGGKLRGSHVRARRIAQMWLARGGKLAKPVETNMVWLDIQREGYDIQRFVEVAAAEGIRVKGGRLVVHYQISDEAVERLGRVMDKVRAGKSADGRSGVETNGKH